MVEAGEPLQEAESRWLTYGFITYFKFVLLYRTIPFLSFKMSGDSEYNKY